MLSTPGEKSLSGRESVISPTVCFTRSAVKCRQQMFKEGPGVRMNLQMKMHKNYRLRKEDGLRGKHLKKRKIRCAFIFYINLKEWL